MKLMEIILNNKISDLSIVGMAKNVGKTVTLNYLIQEGKRKGFILGLTSTGRDGERKDLLTQQKKPLIAAPKNCLIATSRECLKRADAKIEILQTTNLHTPLGEVIIGRIREEGFVELAGPVTSSGMKKVIDILKDLNCQLVLVDGAIDRIASASPAVAYATVLATGAVLGHSIDTITEKTALMKELFSLEKVDDKRVYDRALDVINQNKTALYSRNKDDLAVKDLKVKTALNAGKQLSAEIGEDTTGIILHGALVDRMVQDIMNAVSYSRLRKGIDIIVPDGTKVFLSPEVYRRFAVRGGCIKVVNTINLLAVTVNPFSPSGYVYDPLEFLHKMKTALAPIPVFDIMLERQVCFKKGVK